MQADKSSACFFVVKKLLFNLRKIIISNIQLISLLYLLLCNSIK